MNPHTLKMADNDFDKELLLEEEIENELQMLARQQEQEEQEQDAPAESPPGPILEKKKTRQLRKVVNTDDALRDVNDIRDEHIDKEIALEEEIEREVKQAEEAKARRERAMGGGFVGARKYLT